MKRIGVFCFYDREGIVDGYIEFLLHELKRCLSDLVIVINGKVSDQGKLTLKKFTDEIYIRENRGFDGGAYKDVILNSLGWNRIQQYDELVLCNDTFYGPFVTFESIFEVMERRNLDFWGLNFYYNRIADHIQSYFLVLTKKIINENNVIKYFDKNINPDMIDIADIYSEFETGLYCFLINQGCTFGAFSENNPFDIFQCGNICVKEYNVPILKKKFFSSEHFVRNNALDVLKYLKEKNNYNIDFILNNIKRVYDLEINKQEIDSFHSDKDSLTRVRYDVAKVSDKDIAEIILAKKNIYIYGLGIYSGKICKIVSIYHGKIEGYIVSDDQPNIPKTKNGIKVYKVSELCNAGNMVIIVGLNKEHTEEVAPYLQKFKEVIFLW